jgi:hypothetical protein
MWPSSQSRLHRTNGLPHLPRVPHSQLQWRASPSRGGGGDWRCCGTYRNVPLQPPLPHDLHCGLARAREPLSGVSRDHFLDTLGCVFVNYWPFLHITRAPSTAFFMLVRDKSIRLLGLSTGDWRSPQFLKQSKPFLNQNGAIGNSPRHIPHTINTAG